MQYDTSFSSDQKIDKKNVLTVFELNEYIRMLMEGNPVLRSVWVKGEISNFTNHRSGHLYFSLKDEDGLIRAVMFRNSATALGFLPEEGMKVLVHGRLTLYGKTGQYQINVDTMQPDGVGGLYLAFEQLKRKLEQEGLFASERKQRLPRYPRRIGIITSPTGAAIRDMIQIAERRFPLTELILYPSLVQGSSAPMQLISGIQYFEDAHNRGTEDSVDLIIIGRGGGSIEDLWAFNHEGLARVIASATLPIISAVGHETDFTICDFVADQRAPTPSAAAELALPDAAVLMRQIGNLDQHLTSLLLSMLERKQMYLKELSSSPGLSRPSHTIDEKRIELDRLSDRLDVALRHSMDISKNDMRRVAERFEALNPLAVLSRGYCAVSDASGRIRTKAEDLLENDHIILRFADGSKSAIVTGTHESTGKESVKL